MATEKNPHIEDFIGALREEPGSVLDFGVNPELADELAVTVSAKIQSFRPDVIITWETSDDVIFGHIVARELKIPRVSVELDLGLLSTSRVVQEGTRVVLVGADFGFNKPVDSIKNLLESKGAELVAAISIGGNLSSLEAGSSVEFIVL